MSYLSGTVMSWSVHRAIISLWFRIPQKSIDDAAKEYDAAIASWDHDGQTPQMAGIIPLVTFGKVGTSSTIRTELKNFGSWVYTNYVAVQVGALPDSPYVWVSTRQDTIQIEDEAPIAPDSTWNTEPSYIGVWCRSDQVRLAINLEFGTHASITGVPELVGHDVDDRQAYFFFPPTFPPPARTWNQTFTYEDINQDYVYPQTECLRSHPLLADVDQPYVAGSGITVAADRWHHLLLSFDTTKPCITHGLQTEESVLTPKPVVVSAPKMWIAFDNANKNGRQLSCYNIKEGVDDNWIISPAGRHVADTISGFDGITVVAYDPVQRETETVTRIGTSEPTYDSGTLPILLGGLMGFPASSRWVDHIHEVEMAEFQMFAGIAADTSDESIRNVFVKDGKPVPPKKEKSDEDDTEGSIAFFGREPDMMLHGSGKWISGSAGNYANLGQVAAIKRYIPDPKL
jgi:hypothetical protein